MSPSLRERYGPWALVAGASDGIGEAFLCITVL
jgi:short-subunit dehydrogenase